MKKLIACGLCLFCFIIASCGTDKENASALTAIDSNGKASWEATSEQKTVDKSRSILEEEEGDEEEGLLVEPENGHIIVHNPEYRAPVYTTTHSKDSDGTIKDGAFSYKIPKDYTETVVGGNLVYVMDEENGSHSVYVYTEDISGLDPKEVIDGYDSSIKDEFGETDQSDMETYNGLEYRHYLCDGADSGEHGFVNIYVLADETALIYIEFYDTATVYDEAVIKEFMNNIFLLQ